MTHDTEVKVKKLQEIIDESQRIVFFGGAGVSTESGIPDFRSVDGLYHQKFKYPPETMLSHTFFKQNTWDFFDFYKNRVIPADPKPNAAHLKLAELEKAGKLIGVVTQNIDGLHQAAGSEKVYELHGSVLRNYCTNCGKFFDYKYILEASGIPECDVCGSVVKPDVVLYEEGLDNDTLVGAVNAISSADTMIVAGTSLVVYPAAGLLQYFRGKWLVLINRDPTPADKSANLVIHDKVGEVLSCIKVN
ncbi:MAG: NAD-dependent protein deacylase [Acutalibacteraceae bacterium]|nr:NAD-dependent protein deacylase [Clostridia bacterium]MBQ1529204.1 NAD-dependent protein deacylase [Clostridia bacterium]MEE1292017.1 NAD-dependent protein deacylase [Acutalibacteraceae bacterium]MEE3373584.1 NAD-dependent protein deacylase [Acutalibacteraceae bacterium]NLD29800.1 NAD-dependent protein deacylase [Clostridiales bacterium]